MQCRKKIILASYEMVIYVFCVLTRDIPDLPSGMHMSLTELQVKNNLMVLEIVSCIYCFVINKLRVEQKLELKSSA